MKPITATNMKVILFVVTLGLILTGLGYSNAVQDPVIRTHEITLDSEKGESKSVRIAFLSDTHAAQPSSSPQRLAAIVDQVNAQKPDIVLLGGDFVSTKQLAWNESDFDEAVKPFSKFKAPMGKYAVMGNHDHWDNAAKGRKALAANNITVLDNDAVQIGSIVLGGVDDAFTHHANTAGTVMKMKRMDGMKILLSHSPDITPDVPQDIGLILAGHTHCGQISLPFVGPIATMSKFGKKYACGLVHENGKTIITGAGIGTSMLPIRFGAPPDIWIIDVNPE